MNDENNKVIRTDEQPDTDMTTGRSEMLPDVENNLQTEAVPGTEPGTEGPEADYFVLRREAMQAEREAAVAKEMANRVRYFGTMIIPCLIYTAVFVFCMFKNNGAITTPLWIAALIGLIFYSVNKFDREINRNSSFVAAVMMLIAISNFLTGNEEIHVLNLFALFMLTVYLVLINFADTSKWDLGKHFCEMFLATFGPVGYIAKPFMEASAYSKNQGKEPSENGRKGRQILLGVCIAIPCLVILGLLLGSADMVFDNMLDNILANIKIPENFFGILALLLFGFFSAYCGIHYAWSRGDRIKVYDHRHVEPVAAITVNAAIAVMYLVFSVIQIMYLFIGNFELPNGVTYASYARQGFFQLLFVCFINMILVLAMKKYIKRSRALDIILLIICACTYIMIASSACRMIMYIMAYELTMLRVMVLFALFALAVLMGGVVASIINEKFGFFRYSLVVVCVIYMLFVFSKPDCYIAKYNLDTAYSDTKETKGVDFYYVAELSTDAAPIIDEYLQQHGMNVGNDTCRDWLMQYKYHISDGIAKAGKIRRFNVSYYRASRIDWTN